MRQAAFSSTVLRTKKVRRCMQEVFGWGKTEAVDEVLDADLVCHDANSETGESRGAATIKDHSQKLVLTQLVASLLGPDQRRVRSSLGSPRCCSLSLRRYRVNASAAGSARSMSQPEETETSLLNYRWNLRRPPRGSQ
jgi:hypothetical protein